jgi:ring-1,2-phenylacetyl-CoA epoxidase subunit PaaC
MDAKFEYLLRLGDNGLVLSQQLAAWCGHGPALEEDLALTNVALDLLGQARLWLSYAGEVEGRGRDEDALACGRDGPDFRNLLLVEQPNGHYGNTVARQFLFDAWHQQLLAGLSRSSDPRIADIAQKAVKEVRYHVERSAGPDDRPGRRHRIEPPAHAGRGEPALALHQRMVRVRCRRCAMRGCREWPPQRPAWSAPWRATVQAVLDRATLAMPAYTGHQRGGKQGTHSEHLGHLLTSLQFVQRAYPGAQW